MKKLSKKHIINNSIEAYTSCLCGIMCNRNCSCSCTPIREYNSNADAVWASRFTTSLNNTSTISSVLKW